GDIVSAGGAVAADLVPSIRFLDQANGNQPIPSRRLEMGKSETRNITVRIPTIPPAFASQSFTLRVGAAAGAVGGTDARSFTVGTPVTPSDPSINLQQTGFFATSTPGSTGPANQHAVLTGSAIRLDVDWQMIVMFNVNFTQAGTYDITIQPSTGVLNGWSLQLVNTPTTVTVGATGLQRFVQFGVTRLAAPTTRGRGLLPVPRHAAGPG